MDPADADTVRSALASQGTKLKHHETKLNTIAAGVQQLTDRQAELQTEVATQINRLTDSPLSYNSWSPVWRGWLPSRQPRQLLHSRPRHLLLRLPRLTALFAWPHRRNSRESPRNRRVVDYAIEFRTLAADSGWNEVAIRDAFVTGLTEEIKDHLAPLDLPGNFESLVDMATRIDNRLHERERERHQGDRRSSEVHPVIDPGAGASAICCSGGTHAAGQDKVGSGTTPEDGGSLFLLRGGSSGIRRALVSRPKDKNNPPRSLTLVTLTVNGNTMPFLALIDSGADETFDGQGSCLLSRHNYGTSPESGASREPVNRSRTPATIRIVPPCYHDLKEVFNKAKATSLPPHREWDCAIDLMPGAPIPKASAVFHLQLREEGHGRIY
ncbi:hypothetical protein L3Q82_007408 [Scortum barcoo]|uniref:Uncharacterized protein n=1 Tax=Scortum barcoo TaxID=214431 RepID=A0ACB8WSX6_9TELE|nr:hypothetical protein L3Q82_007408 [Scortum barcoo]